VRFMESFVVLAVLFAGQGGDAYKDGLAAVHAGRWDDAISLLTVASQQHPKTPDGMTCYLLAYAFAQKKDYADTRTWAACALKAKPALGEPYLTDARGYLGWSTGVDQGAKSGYHLQIAMGVAPQYEKDLERQRAKEAKEKAAVDALGSKEDREKAFTAYLAANPCSNPGPSPTPEFANQCMDGLDRGTARAVVPAAPGGRLPE
jgi:hypothetical protein